jgi:(S)-ureidoglycine aminohydrolase
MNEDRRGSNREAAKFSGKCTVPVTGTDETNFLPYRHITLPTAGSRWEISRHQPRALGNSPMSLFGHTRTVVGSRHALIAPDGHVPSTFPNWEDATAFVMLSPAMGADLSQMLVTFGPSGTAEFPADEHEHAIYVEAGSCQIELATETIPLATTGYIFIPSETAFRVQGNETTRLTVFRKEFLEIIGLEPPPQVHGLASDVPGEPFLGNPRALLQTLLPIDPRYDLAINIFTYQPGATLPFVETHIMEHGLLMLAGQGIYRLEQNFYPVTAGDAIWMAPYCPQWFAAIGDEPASYLYYKDVHRLP